MKHIVTTTLCLAGLLLAVVTPSFGQVTPRTAPAPIQLTPRLLQVEEAAPEARGIAADTTLRFYDVSRVRFFDVNLGGPIRAVGTFFTAPFDGTIDRVDFELSNSGASPGVAGTGTLRIKLLEGTEVALNPPFSPGVDSLDVDFSELMAHSILSPGNFINQIDVSERSFDIEDSVEYFIQLGVIDESANAALTVVFDGGSDDSTDTRFFIGPEGNARSLLYFDFLDPDLDDDFFSLRDPDDTTFVHLNVLLELQLSRDEPPPPPPPPPGSAPVQLIHNVPGTEAVDIYVGGSLIVDNLRFQQATPFLGLPIGSQTIDLVAAGDSTNDNPLVSVTDSLIERRFYWAVAHLTAEQTVDVTIEPVRADARDGPSSVTVFHGGFGADSVSVHILDETHDHNPVDTLTQDLKLGQFAAPAMVAPGLYNVEVATDGTPIDVFRVQIRQIPPSDSTALLLLTSGVRGGAPAFGLFLVDPLANVSVPSVSTATETAAVPERFVLHANYPNPFNPTTTIRFDLDAPGFTRLTIYNLLGQAVATLVAEPLTAGVYDMVFDASGLPSGPYLYRLTSGGHAQQRMLMVIK